MTKKIITLLTFLMTSFILIADPKGEEIARKFYNLPESKDSYSSAMMILIDAKGDKKMRKIDMYSKDTPDGRLSFIEFLDPADVKGTKFLTIPHKKGDDEQRLYLPALKKTRRISSSGKDGKFMGSDLTYYDMESRDFEDYNYKYLRDEEFNGMDCYVIEARDKDNDAPYEKAEMWVNKADNFVYKTVAYDSKTKKALKTITILKVQKTDGIITPLQTAVVMHDDGHKTLLAISNVKLNTGLSDSIFSIKNLER